MAGTHGPQHSCHLNRQRFHEEAYHGAISVVLTVKLVGGQEIATQSKRHARLSKLPVQQRYPPPLGRHHAAASPAMLPSMAQWRRIQPKK